MEAAAAGNDAASVQGIATLPVGNPSAGALDDGHKRGAVPEIHHRICHHVGATDRNQIITVAVAPGVVARRPLRDRFKCRAVLEVGYVVMAGRQKDGLSQYDRSPARSRQPRSARP